MPLRVVAQPAVTQRTPRPRSPRLLGVVSVLVVLVVWEIVCLAFRIPQVILPTPLAVLAALGNYLLHGTLLRDLWATLRRVLIGLSVGTFLGLFLGLLTGWYPAWRAALRPLISITFPIPKIALVPLMIIWLGTGDSFKIAVAILGVFYIVLTNVVTGIENLPPQVILAVRNMGASDMELFTKVVLPSTLPVSFAAVRISFSIAIILVIASEMIVSNTGIGHFILFAGQVVQTANVFAGLVVTGIIGLAGNFVIDLLAQWMMPWQRGRQNPGM